MKHGLRALRDTLPNESELNTKVIASFEDYDDEEEDDDDDDEDEEEEDDDEGDKD